MKFEGIHPDSGGFWERHRVASQFPVFLLIGVILFIGLTSKVNGCCPGRQGLLFIAPPNDEMAATTSWPSEHGSDL